MLLGKGLHQDHLAAQSSAVSEYAPNHAWIGQENKRMEEDLDKAGSGVDLQERKPNTLPGNADVVDMLDSVRP